MPCISALLIFAYSVKWITNTILIVFSVLHSFCVLSLSYSGSVVSTCPVIG